MGNSLPPPAAFDLISSYARSVGADIEIVLSDPKLDLPASSTKLTLRRGRRVVAAIGAAQHSEAGSRLVVRVARDAVTDGTWALSLERNSGPRERIDARLLVQGARPLVLLWGAQDKPSVIPSARRPTVTARRRAAAAAGRALDQVLRILPEERARTVRARARTVARRIVH
jgi:hypothetical protein